MMDNTSGVGGSKPTDEPPSPSNLQEAGSGSADVSVNVKIKYLSQLKDILVQHFGEKKGKELYNQFLQSVMEMSLQDMEQAAQQAQDAAKQMGQSS